MADIFSFDFAGLRGDHADEAEDRAPVMSTSHFAAFEQQFTHNLAFKQRDASLELGQFRARLHELAGLATLSTMTLSGISNRSEALEKLGVSIGRLSTADDQMAAVESLLSESDKLPFDQNAHVIARLAQDLLLRGRSGLHMEIRPRFARRVLRAGLKVAPSLLPESAEADNLGIWLNRLADCPSCELPAGTHATLAEAGLADPNDEAVKLRRRNVAKRIEAELERIAGGRGRPEELDNILSRIVIYAEPMRTRLLTMVLNSARLRLCQRTGDRFLDEVLGLLDELTPQSRVTPLEACCNLIHALPNAHARIHLPKVLRNAERLDEGQDFRFNRTRRELLTRLREQTAMLAATGFMPSESLHDFEQRTSNVD